MAQILTQDEVDALLAAVLDEKSSIGEIPLAAEKKEATQDFLAVNKGYLRRFPHLEDSAMKFSKILRQNLTPLLRKPPKIRMISQVVAEYDAWIRTLHYPTCMAAAGIDKTDKSIALIMETDLLIGMLEHLFGNTSGPIKVYDHKELSPVEAGLANRLMSIFFQSLNTSWSEYVNANIQEHVIEAHAHELSICPTKEGVIIQNIMVSFGEVKAKLKLIYPLSALEYLHANDIKPQLLINPQLGKVNFEMIKNISDSEIELAAHLPKMQIKLKDVLEFKNGHVLECPEWTTNRVNLEVAGKRKFSGSVSRHNDRYIVRIR